MLQHLASSPDSIDDLVQMLRHLADPTRLRLLGVLQGGERNVSSLCDELELPQPTVSHHLGLLRQAKLVRNRRNGKQVFYSLNEDVVVNLADPGGVRITADGLEVQLIGRHEQASAARKGDDSPASELGSVDSSFAVPAEISSSP